MKIMAGEIVESQGVSTMLFAQLGKNLLVHVLETGEICFTVGFISKVFSGGPFICPNSINDGQREAILYGLTSYGIGGCGKEGEPDFFADIRFFAFLTSGFSHSTSFLENFYLG